MRLVGADPATAAAAPAAGAAVPRRPGPAAAAGRADAGLRARRAGPAGLVLGERLSLLTTAAGWAARRFRCADALSVARAVPRGCRRACGQQLIEPLCVAALNTPGLAGQRARCSCVCCATRCSAAPVRRTCCCPVPRWASCCRNRRAHGLSAQGVRLHTTTRVVRARSDGAADGGSTARRFDAAVLACSATEAARLTATFAPALVAPGGRPSL